MTLTAIAILLLSSVLHAVWNLFLKKSDNKQVFLWWLLVWSSLFFSPALLVYGLPPPSIGLLLLGASIVTEALYHLSLCWGYEFGDLSIVYPLARGTAPIFITLWALLFLGEQPTLTGWAGIGLVVVGVYVMNMTGVVNLSNPFRMLRGPAVRWALTTGLLISIYSVIDKAGVQYIHPLVYFELEFAGAALFLTPYMFRTAGAEAIRTEWRKHRLLVLGSALCAGGSYALILFLLTFTKVSYIGAARSISVVFGVLLGWLHLREGFGLKRTGAALLIVAGMVCLAMTR